MNSDRNFISGACSAVFLFILSLGCNPEKASNSNITTSAGSTFTCFLYVQGRDSIKLSLVQAEEGVTGQLAFSFYEKDKSIGTIEGRVRGDTLFANYTFTAEGTMSSREVAFLRKGDAYILGTGEIANRGSRDVFSNPRTIDFSGDVVLTAVECQ